MREDGARGGGGGPRRSPGRSLRSDLRRRPLRSPRRMRALIVTNMYPTAARPALGSFVRDQVDALRRIEGVDVELFSFEPGGGGAYARAASDLYRRHRHDRFDVVHAHYGLTAWPAFAASGKVRAVTLHGTDLVHPRARPV